MGGLFDTYDWEQEALDRTHTFCQQTLAGTVTKDMTNWRNSVKQRKKCYERQGCTTVVPGYCPEMEEITLGYGLNGVFDTVDTKEIARKRVHKLFDWIRDHNGTIPTKFSADREERQHAIVVTQLRMAKQGRGHYHWLSEMDKLAEENGCPGLFDDSKTRVLNRTKEFCQRYQGKKLPSVLDHDEEVKVDASWLSAQRQRKKGKATGHHYPEQDAIAAEYGMPGLFDVCQRPTSELAKEWTRQYYQDNGDYPPRVKGRIPYAAEDVYGPITWNAVFKHFPRTEIIDSLRPAFTPSLGSKVG